ncbi:MAG: hypothetical protein JXR71_11785 [Bacteroidales bacterium]|nr:hypothetical protein [Bacteroidales bacterium]
MTESVHSSEKTENTLSQTTEDADAFYQKVENVCFFFEVKDEQQLKKIREWVEMEKKKFRLLKILICSRFRPNPDQLPEDAVVFSKKDFSIFGWKKPPLNLWLKDNSFDLLISFSPVLNKRSLQIVKEVHSNLKAGPGMLEDPTLYDLSIEYNRPMEYADFFEWIRKYYLQLNIKQ